MARIRTVKPDLFKHEDLFDLEMATGLPLRLAFIGMFTVCDREGRFVWRPRTLKTDVLPHDSLDFSRVLDALASCGFIRKYTVDGVEYGVIPSFGRHQVINNKESRSGLPEPDENSFESVSYIPDQRVDHATRTRINLTQGEGKGKEGKGREEEGEGGCDGAAPPTPAASLPIVRQKTEKEPAPTTAIWSAYANAYMNRYHAEPVRNAKVNGQLAHLLTRLGAAEAPDVAAFFVGHNNRYYVQKMHSVDCLLADAEKLRTEWATGRRVTATAAQEVDRLQDTGDMWARIAQKHAGPN
jgi:hypothetical protein